VNIKGSQISPCVPAILLYEGKTRVFTDSSWKVTFEDKEWIDESGKASDKSTTVYSEWPPRGISIVPPHVRRYFKLDQMPMSSLGMTEVGKGTLVDFG